MMVQAGIWTMPAFETDHVELKHVWGARVAAALLFVLSSGVLAIAVVLEPTTEAVAALGGRLLLLYGAYYLVMRGLDDYLAPNDDQNAQPA